MSSFDLYLIDLITHPPIDAYLRLTQMLDKKETTTHN